MGKSFIIYGILCPITLDIVYVGKTKLSLEDRWNQHIHNNSLDKVADIPRGNPIGY